MKKKILYIINSLKNGGPVNMLYTLVKYINIEEWDITILAINKCKDNDKRNFQSLNCNVIELNNCNILKKIKEIKKIVENLEPHIIHSHGGNADYISSKIVGCHCKFTTIHCIPDEDFIYKKGKILGKIKAKLFYNTIKKIENPIACSKSVADKINVLHGYNIKYVQNGIDIEYLNNLESYYIKEDLGIKNNQTLYVFCGYLSKRKNVNLLIDTWGKWSNDNSILLILGDGSEFNKLKKKSQKYKNIIMVGKVKNSVEYLKCADYFISASLSEGLPLAVMEGLAMGLPAILSNIPSHIEIKELGTEAVEIFDVNNINNLLSILNKNKNKNLYIKNRIIAKNIIYKNLNAKNMALKYEKLYNYTLHKKYKN